MDGVHWEAANGGADDNSLTGIAARVQGLSHGGDIAFTDTIRSDLDAQALMGNQSLESIPVTLKGIEGQLLVHRMTVFGG